VQVAARLVAAQRSVRLCIARDLTEHDIVARTMRRENYLIAMLNAGKIAAAGGCVWECARGSA
jgi:autophagy-related protein 9